LLQSVQQCKRIFIFLESGKTLKKLTDITACQETGLHRIYSSLILWNKIWASSIDQIFINNTYSELEIKSPEIIEVRQNESKVFDVEVKNVADTTINNLKLVIEHIPLQWGSIKPDVVASVKPNETAVFIVNVTIPEDAEVREYPAEISIAGTETLTKEETTLKVLSVTSFSTTPIETIKERLLPLEKYKNIFTVLIIGMIGVVVVIKMRKRKAESTNALLKIKNVIRG